MQVLNITLVQMVYYSPSVCVNCSIQYCHWVNPPAQPYWKCCAGSGMSCSWNYLCGTLFTASLVLSPQPVVNSSLPALQKHSACLMNPSFQNKFYVLCCVCVCSLRFVCMHVFNELFVFVCWLNSRVSLSLFLSVLPLGHLPFSCLFFWLLLRSRDKAHWCLSAPWQITEADRYKDSGRQLQYTGGQRRTCLGCLSWPQHQSSLNAIWLPYMCCCCSANYCSKRNTCESMWEIAGNFFELGTFNDREQSNVMPLIFLWLIMIEM